MPFGEVYQRQIRLRMKVIPHVSEEACFALKGGTAINLFIRDMPRLSVDIDLTYLPVAPRQESLMANKCGRCGLETDRRADSHGVARCKDCGVHDNA